MSWTKVKEVHYATLILDDEHSFWVLVDDPKEVKMIRNYRREIYGLERALEDFLAHIDNPLAH